MASMTDPARELGEIAERLTVSSNLAGEKLLAEQFGVEPWSTDFVKIIACILDRADLVARIIVESDLDVDHRDKAVEHIRLFKSGFTGPSLRKPWNDGGNGLTAMRDHGSPIQFLSQTVRPQVKYPRLSAEEIAELLEAIDSYLAELRESDEGPEFVRQAIIDGLSLFRFQLDKIGWMGAGYALTAFRELLFVYDMSQREIRIANPDAGAFLGGLLGILTSFKSKVDSAKGWRDAAEMARDTYLFASGIVTPLLLTGQLPVLPAS